MVSGAAPQPRAQIVLRAVAYLRDCVVTSATQPIACCRCAWLPVVSRCACVVVGLLHVRRVVVGSGLAILLIVLRHWISKRVLLLR